MLLISQNLTRYIDLPEYAIIRINLAWVENLNNLEKLVLQISNDIFIDLPVGRTKPPNNTYKIEELKSLIKRNNNIKYLAISNVESSNHITEYIKLFKKRISIVPKIETKKGIDNIADINNAMIGEKIIMLDHDDLFADLIRNKFHPSKFFSYVEKLNNFCKVNSIKLFKVRGVIFSDEDEYHYQK